MIHETSFDVDRNDHTCLPETHGLFICRIRNVELNVFSRRNTIDFAWFNIKSVALKYLGVKCEREG